VILLFLEILSSSFQTLGGLLDKRNHWKRVFIFGGLALFVVFRCISFYNEHAMRDDSRRKDEKLAYQEAVLKKVAEKELNRAHLAVVEEEGKLKLLGNMRSEFAEMLRHEDQSGATVMAHAPQGVK
jgi:hypothetical protein